MAKAKKPLAKDAGRPDLETLVAQLEKAVGELSPDGPTRIRKARAQLEAVARRISAKAEELDRTKRPSSVFDPSNPALVGRYIAITMIAQDRVPLAAIDRFYGAGVYAIYYRGDFPQYGPLSKTEHPIYVGKADPEVDSAKTVMDHGTKLWDRLNDHRKSITKVSNLAIGDFECRFLVVAPGYQKSAEDYLIKLFEPIWNNEMGLAYGIGKHGDAAETRGNKRSPWDTLHPGRAWAADIAADQKDIATIDSELKTHFGKVRPYTDVQDIFSRFMAEMHQLRTISSTNTTTPP